ncbi:MAG TPA: hypothetical protein VHN74_02305 [Candidatus Angelobacter sp.]|nr:hypothetical protein [Candidatus Angelobacter sp.]
MRASVLTLLFLTVTAVPKAHAQAALLLAEPYGEFGSLSPTGHAAVYLSRVCAATPTQLRRCETGEYGAVISRYYKIAGYDWLAIPLIPYLYAVKSSQEVPRSADPETVASLRDSYRRIDLQELVPDTAKEGATPGEWYQLVGAAYDRRIIAFEIETTEAQDNAFIREFNARRNKSRFSLLYRNCADFTRDVVNFYYPGALKRSIIADAGITTPKQIAKSLVRYSRKHPELQFSAFIIPQIPGSRPPSGRTRGVLESLVKSKKYILPLIAVNIWITPGLAAGYIAGGRFNPLHYAETVYEPFELEQRAVFAAREHRTEDHGGLVAGALIADGERSSTDQKPRERLPATVEPSTSRVDGGH